MIAVSITVEEGRTVEATVADTVPVAELVPHLVEARPGELWRLSGPLGVLAPENSLAESAVRPGDRLALSRTGLPAPPVDEVGRLSGPVGSSPAVWVAALVAAVAGVLFLSPAGVTPVWHPLDVSPTAQALLDGTAPMPVIVTLVVMVLATLAAAAGSLADARAVPLAAVLGFGTGLQVSVAAACLCSALAVWRGGPVRTVTVGLSVAAVVNVVPGLTVLAALTVLTFSGQIAVGLAGIPLPRIPATGLFAAADSSGTGAGAKAEAKAGAGTGTAEKARQLHPAIVVACCTVLLAGAVQLLPPGDTGDVPWWTTAALLAVAATGLSARACRPVHAVTVTVTATLLLLWVTLHLPFPWTLLALLPVALPAVRISSPLAGRVLDVVETVAFTAAVPLLIATTGVFDLVRGIG